jgi:hypothetical protein
VRFSVDGSSSTLKEQLKKGELDVAVLHLGDAWDLTWGDGADDYVVIFAAASCGSRVVVCQPDRARPDEAVVSKEDEYVWYRYVVRRRPELRDCKKEPVKDSYHAWRLLQKGKQAAVTHRRHVRGMAEAQGEVVYPSSRDDWELDVAIVKVRTLSMMGAAIEKFAKVWFGPGMERVGAAADLETKEYVAWADLGENAQWLQRPADWAGELEKYWESEVADVWRDIGRPVPPARRLTRPDVLRPVFQQRWPLLGRCPAAEDLKDYLKKRRWPQHAVVYFPFAKIEPLESSVFLREVERLYWWYSSRRFGVNRRPVLCIQGHADRIGGEQENQSLSEERARGIEALVKKRLRGVSAHVEGFGSHIPISETDEQQNRRVEVYFRRE